MGLLYAPRRQVWQVLVGLSIRHRHSSATYRHPTQGGLTAVGALKATSTLGAGDADDGGVDDDGGIGVDAGANGLRI